VASHYNKGIICPPFQLHRPSKSWAMWQTWQQQQHCMHTRTHKEFSAFAAINTQTTMPDPATFSHVFPARAKSDTRFTREPWAIMKPAFNLSLACRPLIVLFSRRSEEIRRFVCLLKHEPVQIWPSGVKSSIV